MLIVQRKYLKMIEILRKISAHKGEEKEQFKW